MISFTQDELLLDQLLDISHLSEEYVCVCVCVYVQASVVYWGVGL